MTKVTLTRYQNQTTMAVIDSMCLHAASVALEGGGALSLLQGGLEGVPGV